MNKIRQKQIMVMDQIIQFNYEKYEIDKDSNN